MATIYNFSRTALLKRIGVPLGKKPLIFFISAVLITLPLGYAYNSIAIVLFVLYSLLSAKKKQYNIQYRTVITAAFFCSHGDFAVMVH